MLAPAVGVFVEMSLGTEPTADLIATALAAGHIQFYSENTKQAKGCSKANSEGVGPDGPRG